MVGYYWWCTPKQMYAVRMCVHILFAVLLLLLIIDEKKAKKPQAEYI